MANVAYYQTKTKNTSFIKMYYLLKKLGIKNNKFFLRTFDTRLLNVDPWDTNLTFDQKKNVIVECQRNFYYFIREVVRVVVPGGKIPYELNRGTVALNFCLLHNIKTILMLPR